MSIQTFLSDPENKPALKYLRAMVKAVVSQSSPILNLLVIYDEKRQRYDEIIDLGEKRARTRVNG